MIPSSSWRLRRMYLSVDWLWRVFALGDLPHGRDRMPAARGTAFATAMRMVDRVHRHAAQHGMRPFQRMRPALPIETLELSGLETAPTVAMHSDGTMRVSPEFNFRIA